MPLLENSDGIESNQYFFMITVIVHDSQWWSIKVEDGEELFIDGQIVN